METLELCIEMLVQLVRCNADPPLIFRTDPDARHHTTLHFPYTKLHHRGLRAECEQIVLEIAEDPIVALLDVGTRKAKRANIFDIWFDHERESQTRGVSGQ
jgi:hypothetical protein